MEYPQRDRDVFMWRAQRDVFLKQVNDQRQRVDALRIWCRRWIEPSRRRYPAQRVGQIVPRLAMPGEQFGDTTSAVGAPIRIGITEPGDVAGEFGMDNELSVAEQFNQVGPSLVELAQQAGDPAARCLSFVNIVGAELAK